MDSVAKEETEEVSVRVWTVSMCTQCVVEGVEKKWRWLCGFELWVKSLCVLLFDAGGSSRFRRWNETEVDESLASRDSGV